MVSCDELASHPGFRLMPTVPRIGTGSCHDPDQDEVLTEDVLIKKIKKKIYLHQSYILSNYECAHKPTNLIQKLY